MRILYIDIDTLRPDHMGCYGYPRNTTPNLDKVAGQGMQFDRAYCSDAPCLPSRAALITGMFGIRNGAVGHGGTAADVRLTGPKRDFNDQRDKGNFNNVFRRAGLRTVSISTFAERHSSYWYQAGFNETYNVGGHGGESGEEVLPVALDWLSRNEGTDDWYLHLHLWDPHTPYRTPADYPNPFEDTPLPTQWITPEVFKQHLMAVGPHTLNEFGMYDDYEDPKYPKQPGSVREYGQLRRIIDGYDCGIHYADYLLGQVFDELRRQGIYDDTAIIITSDHGENMGELALYGEHGTADEPTCHIPLIIKWPGAKPGRDDGFHYLLDLAPTMADLLHVDHRPQWDGLSMAPALLHGQGCGHDYLVLSQMAHVCQRSARFGPWLYIRTVHDGYHDFAPEMLFNLEEDPYEQHDLSAARPDICAQGARLILNWQEEQLKKPGDPVDPMWQVMREGGPYHTWTNLDRYLKHLENTGRAEGAARLRAKYPEKLAKK